MEPGMRGAEGGEPSQGELWWARSQAGRTWLVRCAKKWGSG